MQYAHSLDVSFSLSYQQFIDILRQMPIEKKRVLSKILNEEIAQTEELPKGMKAAKRKGSYTEICGLWKDMEISTEQFRQNLWQRTNIF